jgi:hypothetical protein
MSQFTVDQELVLAEFSVDLEKSARFLSGEQVLVTLRSEGSPGIAVIQRSAERVRCGVFSIRDPGGGFLTLARFKANAVRLAKAFDCREVELFGAVITNDRLREMLLRQGFVASTAPCPDELGNESWEILSKSFSV